VYLDDADGTVYSLASYRLLTRAPVQGPIQDGIATNSRETVVDRMSGDEGADAYNAVIRSELLGKLVGSAWQSEIELERAKAEELSGKAGLSEPPGLSSGRMATIVVRADVQ